VSDKKQLPKHVFRTNLPDRLTLPFGDARYFASKNEGWEGQYLYTVETEDGESRALFASKGLHDALQRAGAGKGAIVDVTKSEVLPSAPGGKATVAWKVEVIDPGTPVANAVRGAPAEVAATSAQAGPGQPAAAARPPGGRPGAEARLAELSAAYAACVDEAKGVWARAAKGVPGEVDLETVHSTASSFFIALTRESFDLSVFASTHGETEGAKALRRLIERVQVEPHLADVRTFFAKRIGHLPDKPALQRSLYVELREAVKSATQAAAEHTDPEDEAEPHFPDVKPVPPGGEMNVKLDGPRRAVKPEPDWVDWITERCLRLYGETNPMGPNNELGELLAKVTRKPGVALRDLTEAQAKTVIRSLDNALARVKA
jgi:hypothetical protein